MLHFQPQYHYVFNKEKEHNIAIDLIIVDQCTVLYVGLIKIAFMGYFIAIFSQFDLS